MTIRVVRTNSEVVPAAMYGRTVRTPNGHFSTDAYPVNTPRYGAPYIGHLPKRLAAILNARFAAGAISQVVYSYSTPIAWLDAGAWVIPNVTYSPTTSSKHRPHLYRLPGVADIPWDAGMDEYMAVLNGRIRYVRRGGMNGYYVKG